MHLHTANLDAFKKMCVSVHVCMCDLTGTAFRNFLTGDLHYTTF